MNRLDVSSRSCESQARSSSRRFTGKPEQKITSKLHAKKGDGSVVWYPPWHPRILRGAMHSGKKWRSALWLNAMHSGETLWIQELELPSIYSFLNPVYNAARSLRSLRVKNTARSLRSLGSNKWYREFQMNIKWTILRNFPPLRRD